MKVGELLTFIFVCIMFVSLLNGCSDADEKNLSSEGAISQKVVDKAISSVSDQCIPNIKKDGLSIYGIDSETSLKEAEKRLCTESTHEEDDCSTIKYNGSSLRFFRGRLQSMRLTKNFTDAPMTELYHDMIKRYGEPEYIDKQSYHIDMCWGACKYAYQTWGAIWERGKVTGVYCDDEKGAGCFKVAIKDNELTLLIRNGDVGNAWSSFVSAKFKRKAQEDKRKAQEDKSRKLDF